MPKQVNFSLGRPFYGPNNQVHLLKHLSDIKNDLFKV